jgi:hypothetical protein
MAKCIRGMLPYPPPIIPRPIISGPIIGHGLKPQHPLHGTGAVCCCATTEAAAAIPPTIAAKTGAPRVILLIGSSLAGQYAYVR